MSQLLDIENLTLSPKEAQSVSEIVAERFYNHPELNRQHRVETGITMKEQILLAGRYGKLGKKLTGCKPPEDNKQLPLSEKFWDPVDYGFRMNHCANEVDKLFKAFKRKMKRGDYDDLQGSEEMLFLISRIEDALIENLHRLIWFGDTAMDIVDNGGYLADIYDGDQDYWKVLNGLWKQIFAGVTAGDITRHTIDENAEVTYADQNALPVGFAHALFKSLFAKADSRLKSSPDKKIYVTDSIAEEWRTYLEDKSLAWTLQETKEGVSDLRYRGAEIIVRDDWDRHIKEFDNESALDKPHRAVFTTPDNIPFGTMDEESLTEVKSWYSDDDDVNYLQVKSRFDVKLIEEYMIVVAY